MQRQSLGSPGSKLHTHGGAVSATTKDEKNVVVVADPTRSDDLEEKNKETKPHRSSSSKPEKIIHLIPVLTLLCFLILYLCSHDPSQSDLAHFNRFKRSSKPIDSTEIADFGGFLELSKGDVLAIRSLKNLEEFQIKHSPKPRSHRKLGDF